MLFLQRKISKSEEDSLRFFFQINFLVDFIFGNSEFPKYF